MSVQRRGRCASLVVDANADSGARRHPPCRRRLHPQRALPGRCQKKRHLDLKADSTQLHLRVLALHPEDSGPQPAAAIARWNLRTTGSRQRARSASGGPFPLSASRAAFSLSVTTLMLLLWDSYFRCDHMRHFFHEIFMACRTKCPRHLPNLCGLVVHPHVCWDYTRKYKMHISECLPAQRWDDVLKSEVHQSNAATNSL